MTTKYTTRCEQLASYMIKNNATVRTAAGVFGISKSTVHTDVSNRLQTVNPLLFEQVRGLLDLNKAQRHLRGGMATKKKYEMKRLTKTGNDI